jgi:hypothetical protein
MEDSKIQLSQSELDLFCNAEIILTKNRIIQKVIELLDVLQNKMVDAKQSIASPLFNTSPKISRGEYYMGLPYVILDYPRESKDQNLFFIRSMFWWGNFYSSTLHISGSNVERHKQALVKHYPTLSEKDYWLGINTDPWVHHFEKDNYIKISELSAGAYEAAIEEQAHIKIATKWPLEQWDLAAIKLFDSWKFLLELTT